MSELKRTILYQAHLDAGATMVDFGGWDMPIQYPEGIIAEHLYCRRHCGIFDVSHMGRIDVEGPDQVAFLQHVLSSNVLALDLNQAQYCIIPDENGYAIDDAYLYRFEEGKYFLVINAGNIDKDWAHLTKQAEKFDVKLTNVSDKYAAIAVQGPESKEMLMKLAGGKQLTPENVKNALNTLTMEGKPVWKRRCRSTVMRWASARWAARFRSTLCLLQNLPFRSHRKRATSSVASRSRSSSRQ